MKNPTWYKTKLERNLPTGLVELIAIDGDSAIISIDGINREYVKLKYIPQDASPGEIITLRTTRTSSTYIANNLNYKN